MKTITIKAILVLSIITIAAVMYLIISNVCPLENPCWISDLLRLLQHDQGLLTVMFSAFSTIILCLTLDYYETDAKTRDEQHRQSVKRMEDDAKIRDEQHKQSVKRMEDDAKIRDEQHKQSVKRMEQDTHIRSRQNELLYISNLIEQTERAKRNLECNPDVASVRDISKQILRCDEVTTTLLNEVKEILKKIQEIGGKYEFLDEDYRNFTKKLKNYLSISSKVYFILYRIKESQYLDDTDKKNLLPWLIFNLSPADKQLLNIIFLDESYKETISAYSYLFSEENVRCQLRAALDNDPYCGHINDEAIDCFITRMKKG